MVRQTFAAIHQLFNPYIYCIRHEAPISSDIRSV
jgi:hypothetical protein